MTALQTRGPGLRFSEPCKKQDMGLQACNPCNGDMVGEDSGSLEACWPLAEPNQFLASEGPEEQYPQDIPLTRA